MLNCHCPEESLVLKNNVLVCLTCVKKPDIVYHPEAMVLDEILTIRDKWYSASNTPENRKAMRQELELLQKKHGQLPMEFAVNGTRVSIIINDRKPDVNQPTDIRQSHLPPS